MEDVLLLMYVDLFCMQRIEPMSNVFICMYSVYVPMYLYTTHEHVSLILNKIFHFNYNLK